MQLFFPFFDDKKMYEHHRCKLPFLLNLNGLHSAGLHTPLKVCIISACRQVLGESKTGTDIKQSPNYRYLKGETASSCTDFRPNPPETISSGIVSFT